MRKKTLALLLALLLAWSGFHLQSVSAAPVHSVRSEHELRDAIRAGEPEIHLEADLLLDQPIDLSGYNGTIDGQNHKIQANNSMPNVLFASGGAVTLRNLTIDGSKHSRLFHLTRSAEWIVEDSTLQDGSSEQDHSNAEGGSIYLLSSKLQLKNTTLQGSRSKAVAGDLPQDSVPHGGAIYANSSELTLDTCTVTDNMSEAATRTGHGGAIYLDNKSKLNVLGGTFSNNRFNKKEIVTGGVIYADRTVVTVAKNAAGQKPKFVIQGPFNTGGAIRLLASSADISDTDFLIGANNIDGYGTSAGAIMSEGSALHVKDSTFGLENPGGTAKLDFAGGFIGVVGEIKQFLLEKCTFTGKGNVNGTSLATYGGAICFESADNPKVENNSKKYTYGDAEIVGCTFRKVSADNWGGAIALSTKASENNAVNLTLKGTTLWETATLFWGNQFGGGIAVGPGNTLTMDEASQLMDCRSANGGGIYNQGRTTITGGAKLQHCWGIKLGGGVYNDGYLKVDAALFNDNDSGRGTGWDLNQHPFVDNSSKREQSGTNIYANKDVIITPNATFQNGDTKDIRVLDGQSAILLTGTLTKQINVSVSEYPKKSAGQPGENNWPDVNQGETQHRKVGYVVAKGEGTYQPNETDAKMLHYISYLDPTEGKDATQFQPFCDFGDHESIGKWDYLLNPEDHTVVLGQRVKLVYHANPNGVDDASKANFPDHQNEATVDTVEDVYKPVIPWEKIDNKPAPKRESWDFVNWYDRAVKDVDVRTDPAKDVMKFLRNKEGEITTIIDPNEIHTYAGWKQVVSITVEKKWEGLADGENAPESVTVKLKADGAEVEGKTLTLNKGNTWKGTFSELPKYKEDGKTEIAYTVEETAVTGFTATVTGNATEGFVITNTKKEEPTPPAPETVSVSVEKKWAGLADGEAYPESVTVNLKADENEVAGKTLTLDAGNSWKGTFSDLPKYKEDGKTEIAYTVEENAVTGFTAKVTGSAANGFVITNKKNEEPTPPEPETVSVSVEKKWAGLADGEAYPESVTVNLKADGAEVAGKTLTLNAKTSWKGTFTDLPKYKEDGKTKITYTVEEDAVTGFTGTVTGSAAEGFVITNKKNEEPTPPEPETVSVFVKKIWAGLADGENAPESVTVKLMADGNEVAGKTLTLDAGNSWKGTFSELPKYKEDGKTEIAYTVEENAVTGFTAEVTGSAANGFVITNKKNPPQPPKEPIPTPSTPTQPKVPPVEDRPYIGKLVPPTPRTPENPKDSVPKTGEARTSTWAWVILATGLALTLYNRKRMAEHTGTVK